jgi:circadian clock protein KaiC
MTTPVDTTYLADNVILFRYFEAAGKVRRALSVVKKRSGQHEHTIREFRLAHGGVRLGPPLKGFTGVYSGTPVYTGEKAPLLPENGRTG